jgi:hypothetical protein
MVKVVLPLCLNSELQRIFLRAGKEKLKFQLKSLESYSYSRNLPSLPWYRIDNKDIQPRGR